MAVQLQEMAVMSREVVKALLHAHSSGEARAG